MKTRAPELSALIIILGSAGPVISTRRSSRSAGAGATTQSRLADLARAGQEVRQDAGIELGLALLATAQQVQADRAEAALEVGDERERIVGQDPIRAGDRGAAHDDAGRGHQRSPRRTVASIRPCGSVVDT